MRVRVRAPQLSQALDAFEMSSTINIVAEPTGTVYRDLLNLAGEVCGSFSLVWRDQLAFGRSAKAIEESLSPFILREVRTDEWPGTKLMGHLAAVRQDRKSVV